MQVQNIECQIAQAQIARLLANEPLNKEVLSDLENHVATCPECQTFIMSKRSTLETMVGEAPRKIDKAKDRTKAATPSRFEKIFQPSIPKAAVFASREPIVEEDEPAPQPKKTKQPSQPKKSEAPKQTANPTVASFWKPLAYSGALALVLFGMSYLLKNPTALFGDKAMTSLPATTNPAKSQDQAKSVTDSTTASPETVEEVAVEEPTVFVTASETDVEPVERPALLISESTTTSPGPTTTDTAPTPAAPPVEAVKPQPKPVVAKPKTIKPKAKARKTHIRTKRVRSVGSVKFYDTTGQPIGR